MVTLRKLLINEVVFRMKYVRGRFLNLDGLEKNEWLWEVSSEKIGQFNKIAKKIQGKALIVAVGADRGNRLRLIQVENHLRVKAATGTRIAGAFFSVIQTADGQPLSMIDFVTEIPNEAQAKIIARIAELHLPKFARHIKHLPK